VASKTGSPLNSALRLDLSIRPLLQKYFHVATPTSLYIQSITNKQQKVYSAIGNFCQPINFVTELIGRPDFPFQLAAR
jgi:hypothetical protein